MARGMAWSEFIRFLQQHKSPNSTLRFYGPREQLTDRMTICDLSLPRRKGVEQIRAYAEDDWFGNSIATIGHWDQGNIPFQGHFDPDPMKIKRGACSVVRQLLADGCLLKSRELDEWLRVNTRPQSSGHQPSV